MLIVLLATSPIWLPLALALLAVLACLAAASIDILMWHIPRRGGR